MLSLSVGSLVRASPCRWRVVLRTWFLPSPGAIPPVAAGFAPVAVVSAPVASVVDDAGRGRNAGRLKVFSSTRSSGQSFVPREPTPRQWQQMRVLGCHLGGVCMAVKDCSMWMVAALRGTPTVACSTDPEPRQAQGSGPLVLAVLN